MSSSMHSTSVMNDEGVLDAPEPSTYAMLFAGGLLGAGLIRFRRRVALL